MAEQVSRQAAKVAAGTKLAPNEAYGKVRNVTITSPATVTWANGDTIASPVILPVGTRILCGSYISCADMGASITADIGLRDTSGTAIDLDGIAAAIDVASAAVRAVANNGALVKDGVEYVTTVPSVLVLTLNGGTPTANAQIRADIQVCTAD
jgi:hypothetical protein